MDRRAGTSPRCEIDVIFAYRESMAAPRVLEDSVRDVVAEVTGGGGAEISLLANHKEITFTNLVYKF